MWFQISAEYIYRCRFPCPVFPKKTKYAAFGHIEAQIFIYESFTVIVGKVHAFYYWCHNEKFKVTSIKR